MMTTAIVKWGNSQGIRLPKTLLENINLAENDTVEVITKNGAIIIKKSNKKRHVTTRERLIAFYGKDNAGEKTDESKEVDWGKPVGKEIW